MAICVCLVVALTLFFRVNTVVVTGEQRYSESEIVAATGVVAGDNLFLLNKREVDSRIKKALPYVEDTRINKKLPDTLLVEIVKECGTPLAVIQDGSAWLMSARGMIVEQRDEADAGDCAQISGCQLLAPSVGTQIALATDYASQQQSLLDLLKALEDTGMLEQVDGIRLDDLAVLEMDYAERFTVKLPYGADYAQKLKILRMAIDSDYVQDNMTGTFDMTRDDGRVYLDQSTR
jgi:cell division protein FtsQ